MSAVAKKERWVATEVPAQVTSFQQRCDKFPGIKTQGSKLLESVAGSIQHLREATDYIERLNELNNAKGPMNGKFTVTLLKAIEEIKSDTGRLPEIEAYNQVLLDEMTQLEAAISMCEKPSEKSILRVEKTALDSNKNPIHEGMSASLTESSMRIYDYCQGVLPTLADYRIQGITLQNRLRVIVARQDESVKGYLTSLRDLTVVTTPIEAAEKARAEERARASRSSESEEGSWGVGLSSIVFGFTSLWPSSGTTPVAPKEPPKLNTTPPKVDPEEYEEMRRELEARRAEDARRTAGATSDLLPPPPVTALVTDNDSTHLLPVSTAATTEKASAQKKGGTGDAANTQKKSS